MEMRASEEITIGQDLTSPFSPISFSLHNSSLLSHCSACFSPLSPSFSTNSHHVSITSLLYCSPQCSSSDSPLHLLSAEHHLFLLNSRSPTRHPFTLDTSDLRAALRLLHYFERSHLLYQNTAVPDRFGGLMSNRENLLTSLEDESDEILTRIKEGGKAMAAARRMRDGSGLDLSGGDSKVEEAALCVVLTNAVEVQDNSGSIIGIAVYDTTFSWINHSCSPNACYRFFSSTGDSSRCRIAPAAMGGGGDGGVELVDNGGGDKCATTRYGWEIYGPRINVRSIKAIRKGEEVTIAYTDLLQPKATRQSDLWFKYRFICQCNRCTALPLAYVDHALQDIFVVSFTSTNLTSAYNFYRDEAVRKLTNDIDDAISEYLTFGNVVSCCEKLEHVLAHGPTYDQLQGEEKLQQNIRLHPLHHLSLNAYTTLASAYKTLGSDLLAFNTNPDKDQLCAFNKIRIGAAYSLLLAGATHHLFLFESSLIVSVANFWTAAGEALLGLANSSVWNLSVEQRFSVPKLSPLNLKCHKCALMDKFEANVITTLNAEFEDISREFLNCITKITPKVWTFLVEDAHYLTVIKDPIDFRWLRKIRDSRISDFGANVGSINMEGSFSRCGMEGYDNQKRINIFQLGAHCLCYGEFLSTICSGKDLYLPSSFRSLLYDEGT